MEARHCTTRDALPSIVREGLRPGSWVTTAPVESMNQDKRVKALELDDNRKGECACLVKYGPSDLTVPNRQPLTSSGYPQMRTLPYLPIAEADCTCESHFPWPAILLIGGLVAALAWFCSQRSSPQPSRPRLHHQIVHPIPG